MKSFPLLLTGAAVLSACGVSAQTYTAEDARDGAQLRAELAILMPILFDPCGTSPAMRPVQERFSAFVESVREDQHWTDIAIARADYDYQMSLVDIACPDFTREQKAEADQLSASVANSVMDRIDNIVSEPVGDQPIGEGN